MPDLESLTVPPTKRRYGWRGSLGLVAEPAADTEGLKPLVYVDPRADLPPVYDQGQLGACTANADCAAFEYDASLDDITTGRLSRLFVYYGERKCEGTLGQGDVGAYGHDGFTVARHGVPAEKDWPYDISTFEGPVPVAALHDEGHYRLSKPVKAVPKQISAMRQVLSNRQTISFGFAVYESFESSEVAQTGIVRMPSAHERRLGGHQMLLVGYLPSEPHYGLARNSYGAGWGIGGYCLMPWAYLTSSLASDFRTIQRPAGK